MPIQPNQGSVLLLSRALAVFMLFALTFASWQSRAQSADYLNALEGEAEGITLDKESTSAQQIAEEKSIPSELNSDWNPEQQATSSSGMPRGLSPKVFEETLKSRYFGTYLFYSRLSAPKKQEIFAFYQQNADPAAIRDHVIQVSKK